MAYVLFKRSGGMGIEMVGSMEGDVLKVVVKYRIDTQILKKVFCSDIIISDIP